MPLSGVEPERYPALLDEKAKRVADLLAPFSPPVPQIFPSAPTGFRMRAEFRVWHDGDALDYVMFRRDDPRTPVPVSAFIIADEHIQALMPALRARLRSSTALRQKLFQAEFMATLAGDLLVTLVYHRRLEEDWEAAAAGLLEELRADFPELSLIGRSRGQKLVLGRDYVRERLPVHGRNYSYRQYEQSFTQPNAAVNIHMIEWASERAAKYCTGDLLELYCGNGNFTLPLARHFDNVIATELAKSSVRAARANVRENGIDNVTIVRLSAQEAAEAMAGVREFRRLAELPRPLREFDLGSLFVDPPRGGLDEHSRSMAAGFDTVIYISCNPTSLAGDLEILSRDHQITDFAQFDQFPYTEHMECGIVLRRAGAAG